MAATLFRPHYRTDLTARQRQVLELVARGRTNFEIAQELGVSLDGAKWHLRELFVKLDVSSREEAAAWWREYNAPRQRVMRFARALVPAGLGKWLIGGAASAAVVIGVAVALIVAFQHSDDPAKQPAATTTSTATTTATASASPPASTTPPPSPETIAGLPVQPMTWGDPVPLPQGVVAWYWMARPYTDGGSSVLMRAWRDSSGELHTSDVIESLRESGPAYAVGNSTMTRLFAAVCPEGICGLGVSAKPTANPRAITVSAPHQAVLTDQLVFRSDDGGISWVQDGKIPGGTRLVGVLGDQALLADYRETLPGSAFHGRYRFYPSGEDVTPPTRMVRPIAIGVTDSGIQWLDGGPDGGATGGAIYNTDGSVSFAPDAAFAGASFVGALPDGQSFFTWVGSADKPGPYIARIGADGKPNAIFSAQTWWGRPLSSDLLIGTDLHPESGQQMDDGVYGLVLFDLGDKAIRPIQDLYKSTWQDATAFLQTAVTGAFAEVHTAGDCLNVREAASTSSKSLGCFADGVLLRLADGIQSIDGVEWQAVSTPSGAAGWASAEYLVT
jgi:DNA-binding CsgD family transcriptional regulator